MARLYQYAEMLSQSENPSLKIGNNNCLIGLAISDKLHLMRRQKSEMLAQNSERIRAKYGDWLTDIEILRICEAERENAMCEACAGLPCKKSRNQKFKQVIQANETAEMLYIANSPCKYIRVLWEQNRLKEMFETSEIPSKYKGLTFEDYEVDANNQKAVQIAHKLLENPDKGAFFYGSYGAGKTMLASIIAQEQIKLGRAVLFSKLPDLLRSIRATFNNDSKTRETDILKKLYEVPVLILDDVKGVRQKKFAGETLFDIIDARYNAKLQTIMTSNNTLKEVETSLNNPLDSAETNDGSRIYDRCKENCFPVKLEGTSRRSQNRNH